jgi:hypothetical protein
MTDPSDHKSPNQTEEVSKMATKPKTAAEIADEAAESGGFLKPSDYVGQTFRIDGFETIETKYGERHIALVALNGSDEQAKMWASGVVLSRQLDAIAENGCFPVTVRLERPDDKYYRYFVVEPEAGAAFEEFLREDGIE